MGSISFLNLKLKMIWGKKQFYLVNKFVYFIFIFSKSLIFYLKLYLFFFFLIPRVSLFWQTKTEGLLSLLPIPFPLLYKSLYHSVMCFISKNNIWTRCITSITTSCSMRLKGTLDFLTRDRNVPSVLVLHK